MRNRNALLAGAAALLWLVSGPAAAEDLSTLDLSGDWYLLVHYKDDRSEDKSITKFEDFAWSVEQEEEKISWSFYPYVMFNEDLELVRREAMRRHLPWEPSEALWDRIRSGIRVGSRASTHKTLRGSRAEGYESAPPMPMGAANMMTYTVNWTVIFEPAKATILITDSLSGGVGLEGREDSKVYEITERVSPTELRGTYAEPNKRGTFRMVKSKREVSN